MNFVVSVIHAVEDVNAAAAFFHDVLGFPERTDSLDGTLMSNGAVAVRLVPSSLACPQGTLAFDMETQDLPRAAATLRQHNGITIVRAETRPRPERAEMCLQAPHGIRLTLVRTFNEDELGILPDLPVSITWTAEADACIKSILRFVPVVFRGLARRRVTERAEKLTLAAGKNAVDQPTALRALVHSTPTFQQERLRQELLSAGIDPEPLFAELNTER